MTLEYVPIRIILVSTNHGLIDLEISSAPVADDVRPPQYAEKMALLEAAASPNAGEFWRGIARSSDIPRVGSYALTVDGNERFRLWEENW